MTNKKSAPRPKITYVTLSTDSLESVLCDEYDDDSRTYALLRELVSLHDWLRCCILVFRASVTPRHTFIFYTNNFTIAHRAQPHAS